MSTPPRLQDVAPYTREELPRVRTPCPAYSGYVAAIQTYNGEPIIVMAATKSALVDVVREINPRIKRLDLSMCHAASIISDKFIDRSTPTDEDEEL
jgi:hypothetical protein